MPASDLPDGLKEALNPKGGAGEARPAVPDGVALDLAEAARHACDATVAAVLEGKRKVLIEARVEGLDPAQKTLDGSAVLAWSKNALSRLPYDNLVLLDAAGTTRLAEEAGITAEPLLLNFGQAMKRRRPSRRSRRLRAVFERRHGGHAAGVPCGGIQESPGRRVEPPARRAGRSRAAARVL